MTQRPGVTINETLNTPQPDLGISLSNGCFVGAINRGPLVPTLVSSWQQFVTLYGGFTPGVTAPDLVYAVFMFFNSGGRQAWIIRVPGGTEAVATVTALDRETTGGTTSHAARTTLTISALNPGAWGNGLAYTVQDALAADRFTLTVYSGGSTAANVVETWRDLSMDPADARYVASVINSPTSGSKYIVVTDAGLHASAAVPFALARPAVTGTNTALVPVVLTGGADASVAPNAAAYATAVALADAVSDPLTLNLPGVTDTVIISAALVYAENRGDAFLAIDPLANSSVSAQVTQAATYAGSAGPSSYGAVYYPRVVIPDPASLSPGATKVVAPGGALLGIYAANDVSNGVQKTPAGMTALIPNAIGLETALTNSDLDTLNSSNINAIRSIPGSGVVVFGGRTLTTTGKSDKYISVRRSLIYIKAVLQSLTVWAVFEENDPLTWQQASNEVEQFLLGFWQQRGLKGATSTEAFYVICDETNNDEASINAGVMNMTVGVALQRPAEFVVINVNQFDGSVSAVEAAA